MDDIRKKKQYKAFVKAARALSDELKECTHIVKIDTQERYDKCLMDYRELLNVLGVPKLKKVNYRIFVMQPY